MSQSFVFDGQFVKYNHSTKTAFTSIREPYYAAGKVLGWPEKVPGIGLNLKIIDFIMKTKCHLVVRVESTGHNYWIYFDALKKFIDTHYCSYKGKTGVEMKVISWKKFVRLTEHESI